MGGINDEMGHLKDKIKSKYGLAEHSAKNRKKRANLQWGSVFDMIKSSSGGIGGVAPRRDPDAEKDGEGGGRRSETWRTC